MPHFKQGMLPGLPASHECAWQHHLECALPGLFQALSHLPSSFSQHIITIFAVFLVFLQVNSEVDEFFIQCEVFYCKYPFLPLSNLVPTSFPSSLKLSAVTSAACPRCYSYRNASEGRLHVQTHTCIPFFFHMVISVLATGSRFLSTTFEIIGGVVCFKERSCKF